MRRILRLGSLTILAALAAILSVAAVEAFSPAPARAQAAAPGLRAGGSVTGNLTVTGRVTTATLTSTGDATFQALIKTSSTGILAATGSFPVVIASQEADGASAVGVELGSAGAFSTAGAKITRFCNPGGAGTSCTEKASVDLNGVFATAGLTCTGSTHCGTQALTAGSATVTVVSGCHAICTDTTAAAAVKCSVSSTTLTITGTSTDSINYFCF